MDDYCGRLVRRFAEIVAPLPLNLAVSYQFPAINNRTLESELRRGSLCTPLFYH